ncbi:MAG: DUF427 domain-containing protein [Rhodobacteraceae bacterium]|nr:DUF427 domain-containing protein [Paracoccaceae bacterium]
MSLPIENVQDYPRPPALEAAGAPLSVRLGETLLAATDRGWRVLETHHAPTYYLPVAAFGAALRPASGGSLCEWKGRAAYFDLITGDTVLRGVAWGYPDPTPAFLPLKGHVALYCRAPLICRVGDVRVEPQPGGFYGGWVTPNLRGTIKGAPGTEWW